MIIYLKLKTMQANILPLILIIVLGTVIGVLYIRILHKEIKIHYSNYYNSRMEIIELEDKILYLEQSNKKVVKSHNALTDLAKTQIDVLNDKCGVRKQTVNLSS